MLWRGRPPWFALGAGGACELAGKPRRSATALRRWRARLRRNAFMGACSDMKRFVLRAFVLTLYVLATLVVYQVTKPRHPPCRYSVTYLFVEP